MKNYGHGKLIRRIVDTPLGKGIGHGAAPLSSLRSNKGYGKIMDGLASVARGEGNGSGFSIGGGHITGLCKTHKWWST